MAYAQFPPPKFTMIAGVRDDDSVDYIWRSQDCVQIGGIHLGFKPPIEISPHRLLSCLGLYKFG